MSASHDPLCDLNHTARQACNQDRPRGEAQQLATEEPGHRPSSVPISTVADSLAPISFVSDFIELDAESPGMAYANVGMIPEPSPRATRAWEETAAAVGATATPPATVLENWSDVESSDGPPPGGQRLLMAGAIAGAILAVAFVLFRTRR